MNEENDNKSKPEPRKRPYARPTLVEYGRVSKLVQGFGSPVPDGMSGMVMFDPPPTRGNM